jgi:hypothetical protein
VYRSVTWSRSQRALARGESKSPSFWRRLEFQIQSKTVRFVDSSVQWGMSK